MKIFNQKDSRDILIFTSMTLPVGMERVVIIGYGWVGQANAIVLKNLGYEVSYIDPSPPPLHYAEYQVIYDSVPRITDAKSVDSESTVFIVCVGDRVSDEGVQDISNIRQALASVEGVKGTVVLRSTVLPDLLEELRFDFYVPEFMHEKNAVKDCSDPYYFVIGTKNKDAKEPSFFEPWRHRAYKVFEGTPREASFIKFLSNIWNALRIAFINEFGDAIGRPHNKERLAEIERIMDFMFDHRNYLRYGRSFGGHCLPKDSRSFIHWYKKELPMSLLSGMYESNVHHAELEKKFPLMPEWYSEWQQRHISGWKALRELGYAVRKNARPTALWKRFAGADDATSDHGTKS